MSNTTMSWNEGKFDNVAITCEGLSYHSEFFGGVIRSISSPILFDAGIFLILYRCARFLLKPLRMTYVAQLLAGFLIAPIFGIYIKNYAINRPSLLVVATILSGIGYALHLFMLGVEINMRKLTKTGKKSCIICFTGFFTSLAFSCGTYMLIKGSVSQPFPPGLPAWLLFNSSNYLMSTISHLNDLGISNSNLGQLALSASMVMDMTFMIFAITIYYVILPLQEGGKEALQSLLVFYYALLFFCFRPLIMYVISLKSEGRPMKQLHFVVIVLSVLVLALMGEVVAQNFSPFLLAAFLPEEPLATILTERLDPFATNILFPFFMLTRGMEMEFKFQFDSLSLALMLILVMGYIGKFVGTFIAAMFCRLPFAEGIALSLIMSSRGVLDITSLFGLLQNKILNVDQYTMAILHSLITMTLILPFAKFLYEPSKQYSTILRHSLLDFQENNNETLLVLVCIHKEESLSGLMSVLKVCHSSPEKPISVIALQLLQLTGRCAMPIMAPLHEVSSISSFQSNIERFTRIVNSFLHLQRENEGMMHTQHFVAMSPYTTIHNDICNLAYEKKVGVVVIPFHVSWERDGTIKESSVSIREVNNMVIQKAPCSVGILVDRSNINQRVEVDDNRSYMVSILFVGGADDYEALAYSRVLFANNPNVKINVIWFKAPMSVEKNEIDYEAMKQFQKSCTNNERISFQKVIVNNGAEIVQYMVSVKDEVDLVVMGKYHNLETIPMLGLSDGWSEYPELEVLGDVFATSDFGFSLLIVQQEPQNKLDLDFAEDI